MAKPTYVKCRFCKKEIERDKSFNPKERQYFCDENCYENFLQKHNPEPQKSDFRQLTDFIDEIYEKDCNWAWITKQIKHYKEEYGWSDKELLLTLRYYVLILEKPYDVTLGLGQVFPRYYKDAMEYAAQCFWNHEKYQKMKFIEDVVYVPNTSKSYYHRLRGKNNDLFI